MTRLVVSSSGRLPPSRNLQSPCQGGTRPPPYADVGPMAAPALAGAGGHGGHGPLHFPDVGHLSSPCAASLSRRRGHEPDATSNVVPECHTVLDLSASKASALRLRSKHNPSAPKKRKAPKVSRPRPARKRGQARPKAERVARRERRRGERVAFSHDDARRASRATRLEAWEKSGRSCMVHAQGACRASEASRVMRHPLFQRGPRGLLVHNCGQAAKTRAACPSRH